MHLLQVLGHRCMLSSITLIIPSPAHCGGCLDLPRPDGKSGPCGVLRVSSRVCSHLTQNICTYKPLGEIRFGCPNHYTLLLLRCSYFELLVKSASYSTIEWQSLSRDVRVGGQTEELCLNLSSLNE